MAQTFTLKEYAALHGQTKAADSLGCYQSAINKALAFERDITVTVHDDGRVTAEERRVFPSRKG